MHPDWIADVAQANLVLQPANLGRRGKGWLIRAEMDGRSAAFEMAHFYQVGEISPVAS